MTSRQRTPWSRRLPGAGHAHDLISDSDTYEKLRNDPTTTYTRKVRVTLKSLEDSGKLSRSQYLKLYPSDPQPPLFYGLPKVHKPGIPLRPIVSTVGSVTYDVAKHVTSLLSPLVGETQHHVKDSDAFVEFVRDLHLADDETMVSFDVTSLFTSVPTDVACDIVRKKLESEMEKEDGDLRAKTGMDVDDILQLLRLCLDTTYFQVNHMFYKQKRGAAMGSPVSAVIANLFMEEVEQKAIQSFPHEVKVWKRYVDDTFVVVKDEHVAALHHHLNQQFQGVAFTLEREDERRLPFLDVEVQTREDGTVGTAVFRKGTQTDKYLDFDSHHSSQHKESVVRSLVRRGEMFPSDDAGKSTEMYHVKRL